MTQPLRKPDRQAIPMDILERLRATRGFVFDMDGTMVLGDKRNHGLNPLPGAIEFTRLLHDRGIPFVLFTNGTLRTPQDSTEALRRIGFALPDGAVMTPASTAADYFRRRGYRRVMVLGAEGMTQPLQDVGIETVPPSGKVEVDAVFVGWYRDFTMDALEAACHAVWAGAGLYSASQSLFFATAEGRSLGTSRAISAMIKDLTGCRIRIIGKPALEALRVAGRHLGVKLKDLAVVGDDPSLEVPMAHRGHALAIGVGTGLGGADAFAQMPAAARPHITVSGVDELLVLYDD